MPIRSFLLPALLLFAVDAVGSAQDKVSLPADLPIDKAIDRAIEAPWREDKVRPAPLLQDGAFLRRLTLDLAGRIPTLAEVELYEKDTAPERKLRAVDRLLASPDFLRHQAQEFFTLLGNGKGKAGPLRDYLRSALAENRPWDRIFRELLVPDQNDPKMQGADEFLKSRVKNLDELTIEVSTVFFGVNVSCAQCHDHPHVHEWKQDHFYGMKSFLARTFQAGNFLAEKGFGVVKFTPNKGTEKVAPVRFLTGPVLDVPGLKDPDAKEKKLDNQRLEQAKKSKKAPPPPTFSMRTKLVETALEQREFFARNIVNRLWARFLGRGLVTPLDQMHAANPPSHPELMAWLAHDLVEHGYDLKRLMRGIVLSDAYARSSRWEGDDMPSDKSYAMGQVRPLTPHQLAASLRLATLDPQSIPSEPAAAVKHLEGLIRSSERWASFFPEPTDNFQVSATEALLFANNEAFAKELLDASGSLPDRLKKIDDPAQRADLAFRTVLSRPARPEEVQALADYFRRRAERTDEACRQVVWALLTSAEFRFNH